MARVATFYFVAGEPESDQGAECACCGFDAVLTFPVTSISSEGVAPFGTFTACVRCYSSECECSKKGGRA